MVDLVEVPTVANVSGLVTEASAREPAPGMDSPTELMDVQTNIPLPFDAPSVAPPLPLKSSSGIGIGGILAILGALAGVVWLFIPGAKGMPLSSFGAADVASKVLIIFALVAALLAIATVVMRLGQGAKGLVLVVLGAGLGVLSVSAPVMQQHQPGTFAVYAGAALFVIGGLLYVLMKPKPPN